MPEMAEPCIACRDADYHHDRAKVWSERCVTEDAGNVHPLSVRTQDAARSALEALLGEYVEALTELSEAAVDVNARYVGGSPIDSERFNDAFDALSNAEVKARHLVRAARTPAPATEPDR